MGHRGAVTDSGWLPEGLGGRDFGKEPPGLSLEPKPLRVCVCYLCVCGFVESGNPEASTFLPQQRAFLGAVKPCVSVPTYGVS